MDRNTDEKGNWNNYRTSPPARVAWIETTGVLYADNWHIVATREGGVDRNTLFHALVRVHCTVATREGGVDRNGTRSCDSGRSC